VKSSLLEQRHYVTRSRMMNIAAIFLNQECNNMLPDQGCHTLQEIVTEMNRHMVED
jgi:hypothetical protein